MGFWKKSRKASQAPTAGKGKGPGGGKKRRRRVAPLEVKVLAMQACDEGLTIVEVAELAGVSASTVHAWRAAWRKRGVEGLVRKSASPAPPKPRRQGPCRGNHQRRERLGRFVPTVAAKVDTWLGKYSPDGEAIWTRTHDGPAGKWEASGAVAVDSRGNVIVARAEDEGGVRVNWRLWVREYRP